METVRTTICSFLQWNPEFSLYTVPCHMVDFFQFFPSVSTSGRLHSEFVCLFFLQTHREGDCFFTVLGVQLPQHDRDQFHNHRAAFSSQIKSKVEKNHLKLPVWPIPPFRISLTSFPRHMSIPWKEYVHHEIQWLSHRQTHLFSGYLNLTRFHGPPHRLPPSLTS